ncbi:hypothetical protein WSM22_39250 [Cytophagales bacterium WSM2-2]|nr:hypothetical protein WSM22_39250 [Cytophagales bacterium WSM2-2]
MSFQHLFFIFCFLSFTTVYSQQSKSREINVASNSGEAKLRVTLPDAWVASGPSILLRDEYQEAIAGVQFTVICNSGCNDSDISHMPKVIDETLASRARPNINTGDPAMDAVRLKVDVVEQGDVANGKFRVTRVTKPAGLEGPYREQLYMVSVKVKRGAKIVAAQGWAPLSKEKELGPLIVNACKTFEIL